MKLNNLSAKKICRLISAGMVFSMLVITGIFGGIMQDTRIFIAGGTLTLCAFFWILAIGAVFLENAFLILLLICAGRWTT
ncbi:hypothetical protein EC1_04810 [Faecalitalea cylindroides T2-87]|uniref:Uncharacterized protein n=1 Tax=Faecalitalea cylindroides T2-87 TaxID=717960 RepID=D4JD85_9FIRM|nr:hypothetical protein EC1_04810 [Faecalitalea cylindroides T2-87]